MNKELKGIEKANYELANEIQEKKIVLNNKIKQIDKIKWYLAVITSILLGISMFLAILYMIGVFGYE